jgi:membrane-bound metal-dependent hydrolase YbcI (DUF457 family)
MDIVTHAGIGVIAAAPFLASRPELALGLVAGSVLPDLDALSRIFGKLAFLRQHQTWSHALLIQALLSVAAGFIAALWELNGVSLALGMFAGFALHTLLDWSNTLGVTLLAPFSRRRFRLEWVFFIDAIVLVATGIAVTGSLRELSREGMVSGRYAIAFFTSMGAYFFAKGVLRHRAGRLAPEARSLVPSALVPWRYYGFVPTGDRVRLFQLNALTGREKTIATHVVLDADYAGALRELPEFNLMRELSPAYHVVSAVTEATGQRISCRDLRTRNFGSTFGDLEVVLDAGGKVTGTKFHV